MVELFRGVIEGFIGILNGRRIVLLLSSSFSVGIVLFGVLYLVLKCWGLLRPGNARYHALGMQQVGLGFLAFFTPPIGGWDVEGP